MAETLLFYANLAETQDDLLDRFPQVIGIPAQRFAERLDPGAALRALPAIVDVIAREAPAALSERVPKLRDLDFDRWRHRIETYWITGGREAWDADAMQRFVLDALLQPFAEIATGPAPSMTFGDSGVASPPQIVSDDHQGGRPRGSFCEQCTGLPVVAMLREHGHGSKRSLVCGFCLTEWAAPRLVCIQCGESRFESLPVFRTDEFDAVRIDACESCKNYVKTIDLTRDGEASPVVDDLASLPLDLWAHEKGYRRARHNLFGF